MSDANKLNKDDSFTSVGLDPEDACVGRAASRHSPHQAPDATCSSLTNAMSEESIEFILKDFPSTRYFPKFKLTTWHPKGVFDEPFADKLVAFIEWEEYIQQAPWDRYADLSAVTEIRISLDHIMETARRRLFVREPVKSALFADNLDGLELVRSYERLMGDATMITVRSFDNRKAAAEWLEVPPSILKPAAAV